MNAPVALAHILVVDDEPDVRSSFRLLLEERGFHVSEAKDGEACLEMLEKERIDVILLDQRLPGMSGLEALAELRKRWDEPRVIMVSAADDPNVVFRAGKLGVEAFVPKHNTAELLHQLGRAVELVEARQKMARLESELEEYRTIQFVHSANSRMRQIDGVIQKVAKLPTTVLILGESGTGKEVVARRIYEAAGDPSRPFVRVNMASIPAELTESTLFGHEKGAFTGAVRQQYGKFELADGGVLFMDEIGELPLSLQTKLLRVIQEGEFERVGGTKTIKANVRLLAATNKKLQDEVAAGRFREDLFYRLNVVPIQLPPLRERPEDIERLAMHFVAKYAGKFNRPVRGINAEAMAMLKSASWQGNIRELENLIERIVAITDGEEIELLDIPLEYQVDALPDSAGAPNRLNYACENFERSYILRALKLHNQHRAKTAEYLGIPLSTLKYKMNRLNLKASSKK